MNEMKKWIEAEQFYTELYQCLAEDVRCCEVPLSWMIDLYGKEQISHLVEWLIEEKSKEENE